MLVILDPLEFYMNDIMCSRFLFFALFSVVCFYEYHGPEVLCSPQLEHLCRLERHLHLLAHSCHLLSLQHQEMITTCHLLFCLACMFHMVTSQAYLNGFTEVYSAQFSYICWMSRRVELSVRSLYWQKQVRMYLENDLEVDELVLVPLMVGGGSVSENRQSSQVYLLRCLVVVIWQQQKIHCVQLASDECMARENPHRKGAYFDYLLQVGLFQLELHWHKESMQLSSAIILIVHTLEGGEVGVIIY